MNSIFDTIFCGKIAQNSLFSLHFDYVWNSLILWSFYTQEEYSLIIRPWDDQDLKPQEDKKDGFAKFFQNQGMDKMVIITRKKSEFIKLI